MSQYTYQRGIGVTAVIMIIAVLAVGGYAAVQVSQRAQVEVDSDGSEQAADQVVANARADAQTTLSGVQADLRANADLAVDAALTALTDLSARLQNAALTVETTARAEIAELRAEVDLLKTTLESNVTEAQAELETVLDDIQVSIDTGMGADAGTDVHGDDGTMVDGDENTTEDDGSSMEAGVDAEANAEANAEVDGDSAGTDIEGEGSIEINI